MNRGFLPRFLGALLLFTLLKYLWLAGYAHPVADDFCYAAKARGTALWDWSRSEWLNWNGRYASNLLMARGPLVLSTDFLPGYRLVPILLIGFTFLACWWFLRRLTRHRATTAQECLGALVFLALYLNLMPDIGEGFYWYTGAMTYQLGSILLLVHLGLLLGRADVGSWWRLPLNVVLAAVIVGMDEIHMVLMVALHIGLVLRSVRHGGSRIGANATLLAVVMAGASLMYLAPGNAVRGAMFADTHQFFRSLTMSALQAVRFIGLWVLSPALLALSVLYIPVHRWLKEHVHGMQAWSRISPWIAGALPFVLVMASTFPAYWSTGLLGQHRTINVACLFFIPLWFLNLSLWLERRPLRRWANMRPPSRTLAMTMLLAVLGLELTRNGSSAYVDLFGGRASNYDHVLRDRENRVRDAANDPGTSVHFTPLVQAPLTLPSYEEHGPLRDWMVHCEARYFGAKEQQVETASP